MGVPPAGWLWKPGFHARWLPALARPGPAAAVALPSADRGAGDMEFSCGPPLPSGPAWRASIRAGFGRKAIRRTCAAWPSSAYEQSGTAVSGLLTRRRFTAQAARHEDAVCSPSPFVETWFPRTADAKHATSRRGLNGESAARPVRRRHHGLEGPLHENVFDCVRVQRDEWSAPAIALPCASRAGRPRSPLDSFLGMNQVGPLPPALRHHGARLATPPWKPGFHGRLLRDPAPIGVAAAVALSHAG